MASNPTIASQVSLFNNTPHLQRPQSLKIASQTAVPLQSLQLQQPTSLFETATRFVALQSANRNQHTVEKSTVDFISFFQNKYFVIISARRKTST